MQNLGAISSTQQTSTVIPTQSESSARGLKSIYVALPTAYDISHK